ncbi:MAG: glycosyltransferase family 4 protein [Ignavibacteria bacterium]|nr:glycosyltransferase family 4 protein [Ignavibacteria bacterium]
MKILQINNSFEKKGGAEAVFLNTIYLLRSKGNEVVTFSRKCENSSLEYSEKYFLPDKSKSNSIERYYAKQSANLLSYLIENEKPDVAHIHNIHGEITFSILPVLKRNRIPIVASIHGFKYLCPAWVFINGRGQICEECKSGKFYKCFLNNCSQKGKVKSFQLAVESYLRDWLIPYDNYIDKFLFVSNFTQNKFLEFNPSILNKSSQLYNFVTQFDESSKGKHNKYFLYLGRLAYEKGIKTLVDAFKQITQHKLIIAGNGPLEEFVKQNENDNIEYVGYKNGNELESLIMNAFFLVVPTETYENNPMTIVEAYSKAKPVIGTNLGGIPEIVQNGKNGFLFEPKNSKQLTDVINKCSSLTNREYSNISENAFMFAKRNFNPENHFEKLIAVYKEILDRKN